MSSEVAQRALRDPASRTRRDRIRERARKRKVATSATTTAPARAPRSS